MRRREMERRMVRECEGGKISYWENCRIKIGDERWEKGRKGVKKMKERIIRESRTWFNLLEFAMAEILEIR